MPDGKLLSIGQLRDSGSETSFKKHELQILHQDRVVLKRFWRHGGWKVSRTGDKDAEGPPDKTTHLDVTPHDDSDPEKKQKATF